MSPPELEGPPLTIGPEGPVGPREAGGSVGVGGEAVGGGGAAEEPLAQDLGRSSNYPYPTRVYIARILWEWAYVLLFRWSPRRAYGWRVWLLNRFGGRVHPTARVRRNTIIKHPWLLEMGEYSSIGDEAEIYNLGMVKIGANALVSQRALLCAGTHDYRDPTLPLIRATITIEPGVWVCAEAFVGPGVTIGRNTVVGARAVVMKDVPAGKVVMGNPGVVVKDRGPPRAKREAVFRPLDITVITGPFNPLPPAPCGAMEMVWSGLAEELAAMGHRVRVLSSAYEGFPAEEERHGVRISRRMRFRRGRVYALNIFRDMLYALGWLPRVPRSDVIVCNALFLPLLLTLYRRGMVNVNMNRFPKWQVWLYLLADRIAAASPAVAEAIVRQTPPVRSRVRVFPNPIRAEVFTPAPDAADGPRSKVVLFTGRIHPEKGLELLVQAFRLVHRREPGAVLRLIGPSKIEQGGGGERFVGRLRELAGDAPVEIEPPIYERERLAAALREAGVYVYPSVAYKGEACPVAPIEAMSVGLAVVVSGLPQFLEYLRPNENGLVFDHTAHDAVERLAGVIGEVLADEGLARRLGAAAHRSAQAYSYAAIAARLVEDTAELLGLNPATVVRERATSPARRLGQPVAAQAPEGALA